MGDFKEIVKLILTKEYHNVGIDMLNKNRGNLLNERGLFVYVHLSKLGSIFDFTIESNNKPLFDGDDRFIKTAGMRYYYSLNKSHYVSESTKVVGTCNMVDREILEEIGTLNCKFICDKFMGSFLIDSKTKIDKDLKVEMYGALLIDEIFV